MIFPAGALTGVLFGAGLTSALGMGEPAAPLLSLGLGAIGLFTALRLMTSLDAGDRGPQLEGLRASLAEIGLEEVEKKLGRGFSR